MKKERFPSSISDKIELFSLKSNILLDEGYSSLSLERFLEVVFTRRGVLHFQEPGEEHYYDNHYNGIVMFLNPNRPKCRILNRGFRDQIEVIRGHRFAISSPLTYIGRSRKGTNARYAFGFAIDLDGVAEKQIRWLIYNIKDTHTPRPNIIVNSGNGLHVYYLFEKPVALFPQSVMLLQKLKEGITRIVWNKSTSVLDNDEDLQIQGIFQGFRLPETLTKFGTRVTAFYDEEAPLFTIKELNDHYRKLKGFHRLTSPLTDAEVEQIEQAQYIPSKVGIEEAKRLYPDWYEKRIIRGETNKGWIVKRDLYDWYLGILGSGKIKEGHRYFALMCLSSFAIKCGIPYDELREDAYSFLERFEEIKAGEDNHFTEEDIEDALKAYEENYRTFPRKTIEKLIGVIIPAPKRNYRKQDVHLEIARATRDIVTKIKGKSDWREGSGRPVATLGNSEHASVVREWRLNNLDNTNKSQCARDTGLSRPTVHKWWGE